MVAGLVLLLGGASEARADLINFDVDANGNTINAPPVFLSTTALRDLYAPLGVHFNGLGGNDGGAILNQLGGFGVNARSQPNFLAFNGLATLSNGGIPRGPETITFDSPQSAVSIFASDAGGPDTFRLDAFNAAAVLVASDTESAPGGAYAQLSVSGAGITRVVVTELGGVGVFVLDDLSFTPAVVGGVVPEPSSLALLGFSTAALVGWRLRRRHTSS
jgi:hypothetical protein